MRQNPITIRCDSYRTDEGGKIKERTSTREGVLYQHGTAWIIKLPTANFIMTITNPSGIPEIFTNDTIKMLEKTIADRKLNL